MYFVIVVFSEFPKCDFIGIEIRNINQFSFSFVVPVGSLLHFIL